MGDSPVGDAGVTTPNGETPYRRLVEGLSAHAVFMLDAEGTVTAWPTPAEALYGYDAGTMLGRSVGSLFADGEGSDPDVAALLDEAGDAAVETNHWHQQADGSVFRATMTVSPLCGDGPGGYAVVSHDTTANKQYEGLLERQNDRLKEFTDTLAHDLRNPLNMIDQLLVLYRETGDEDHIDSIEETTDRMERLVDDLLRVARQGGVVTEPERTDTEEVVATAWAGTGATADGATLHCEALPPVSAEADRLRQLFENLFRNAMEHAGGEVTVRVGPLENGIYVVDDGPGLPEGSREAVFDHGFTTREDGSGYGLSVVRTIASAHGWDVTVTSGESGGARFEITGIEFV